MVPEQSPLQRRLNRQQLLAAYVKARSSHIAGATAAAGSLSSLPACESSPNGTLILTPSPAPGPDLHWEGTPN